jgi:hypothetical protein
MTSRNKLLAASAVLILAGAGIWLAQRQEAPAPQPQDDKKTLPAHAAAAKPAPTGFQVPAVNQAWQAPVADKAPKANLPVEADFGKFEASTPARLDNPQARSNIEALRNPGKFPERLSAQVQGQPIDVERFKTDAAYHDLVMSISEPSRALASSSDPKAFLIKRLSEPAPSVKQGESILLRTQATPGALVAYFAPNGGRFSNGLTHISVTADSNGQAEVQFDGISGVKSSSEVICASPMCAGTLVYKIETLQADDKQAQNKKTRSK